MLRWLIHTDAGLLTRILTGCAIFAVLAVVDFRKNRSQSTRWREYGVLVVSVLAALFYGAINDQITVTISPEYFIYGKEIDRALGDDPTMPALRWEAAEVGFKATWSAGLVFGVALLIVNNPYRGWPRLRNRRLIIYLPIIMITAAACGIIGGLLGQRGYLTRLDSDFAPMVAANMYRPYRFMAAWGVHLGGYIGGMIGTIIAACFIVSKRLRG